MSDVPNWIPSSFSKPPEVEEEAANSEPPPPPPLPDIPETVEMVPIAVSDPPSDDLSFDLISRQKLSLTPQSSGISNQDRLSPRGAPGVPVFEEDTRSSWSVDSTKTNPIKEVAVDENSQNSCGSQKSAVKRKFSDEESNSIIFPPDNVFEYMWPLEKGEFYFLQEQISDYLSVKSFKRKYPDLQRRSVDIGEKQFLRERGVVTETQCDLGLTALRSEDVMELMSRDYPEKYKDYIRVLREKEKRTLTEKQKEHTSATSDKNRMADTLKKAIKSASEYNAHLNQERKEERQSCFDLQTYTIHYPTGRNKVRNPFPKMGMYPVALLPGQFQDRYKKFTPEELKYLPLNTVLYGPMQEIKSIQALSDASHSDSEDSTASDGSCSSSQGTHDEGSGESTSGSEKNTKSQSISNSKPPSINNSKSPSVNNSKSPSVNNSKSPSVNNSKSPSINNSKLPSVSNSKSPSVSNSKSPSVSNSKSPSVSNSKSQTINNSKSQTINNSKSQTINNSKSQTINNNKSQTINNNKSQTINNNKSQTINNNKSQTVNNSKSQTVNNSKSQTINYSKSQTINNGKSQTVNNSKSQAINNSKSQTVNNTETPTTGKLTPKPQTPYKPKDKPNAMCKVCKLGSGTGKDEKNEPFLHCSQCESSGHPTCLELALGMVEVLKTYPWQCMDCKNCSHCRDPYDEDKMLFCDNCDRGYHTFCVGLKALPQGKWICQLCGHCAICGATKPGPETAKAQWQYDAVPPETIVATRRPQIVCQTCFKRKH